MASINQVFPGELSGGRFFGLGTLFDGGACSLEPDLFEFFLFEALFCSWDFWVGFPLGLECGAILEGHIDVECAAILEDNVDVYMAHQACLPLVSSLSHPCFEKFLDLWI